MKVALVVVEGGGGAGVVAHDASASSRGSGSCGQFTRPSQKYRLLIQYSPLIIIILLIQYSPLIIIILLIQY